MTTPFTLVLAQDYERRAEYIQREIDYINWSIEHSAVYHYSSARLEQWKAEVESLKKEMCENAAEALRLRGTMT